MPQIRSHRSLQQTLTTIISVGEFDAEDVQCNSQINDPPRVRVTFSTHAIRWALTICVVEAIVSVLSKEGSMDVRVRTALVGWTIESNVDIEASVHCQHTSHHDTRRQLSALDIITCALVIGD